MLQAGDFNRRIALQEATVTREADGSVVESYADWATVWAAMSAIGGREVFESGKITGEVTHRFRIRFRAGVHNRMRVKLSDTATSPATERYFKIMAVLNPREGREELHIMAQEMPDGDPV